MQRRYNDLPIEEVEYLLRGLRSLPFTNKAFRDSLSQNNPIIHESGEFVFIDAKAFPSVYADASMLNIQLNTIIRGKD